MVILGECNGDIPNNSGIFMIMYCAIKHVMFVGKSTVTGLVEGKSSPEAVDFRMKYDDISGVPVELFPYTNPLIL